MAKTPRMAMAKTPRMAMSWCGNLCFHEWQFLVPRRGNSQSYAVVLL